jgi:hypothetical protein
LQSQGCSKEAIAFHIAFYEYSLRYENVKYDGNYFVKAKRIVQVTKNGFSLKLSNMDNYTDEIATMPESIKIHFTKNYCNYCDFQGATSEHCKYRLKWTYGDTAHDGCAFICFSFQDYDTTLVPHYWRLLALEYEIKRG